MTLCNNYFNNKLILKLDKKPNDDEQLMLKYHFECSKYDASFLKFKYFDDENIIKMEFHENVTKRKIMKRSRIKLRGFTVTPVKMNDIYNCITINNKYERMLKMLCFKGFTLNDSITINMIVEYIESLLKQKVKKISISTIFNDVVYAVFDDSVYLDDLHEKMKTYKPPGKKEISVYECFETGSVFIKFNSKNFINNFQFHEYLNNNFNINNVSCWQTPFDLNNSPFFIIKFNDLISKGQFFDKHENQKIFFIENNYNVYFLNQYLQEYEIKNLIIEPTEEENIIVLSDDDDDGQSIANNLDYNYEQQVLTTTTTTSTTSLATNTANIPSSSILITRNINNIAIINNHIIEPQIQNDNNVIASLTNGRINSNENDVTNVNGEMYHRRQSTASNNIVRLHNCQFCPFKSKYHQSFKKHMILHIPMPDTQKCRFCPYYHRLNRVISIHENALHINNQP